MKRMNARLLYALAVLCCTAFAIKAAPPAFQVENRCPQFTVVNKAAPSKTVCGCAFTGDCTCWEGSCGCVACKPAKPVAKAGLNIDPDHVCNKCGSYSNVVSKQAGGMHSHVCTNPGCRNEWWHSDPGTVSAPQTYSLPASSGCANGNCAAPSQTYRRRIFR